ncbi:MAG TPA: glycosyltransferase [Phototrophicaceae bacterium]|jgi:D-inositol-3-phosphate glycosyltransferase|nr:glycosyltransferase [Phototrophicaceae bacterium]
MGIQRIAILSVHTSPLATPGGKKVGGMNVYVRELARELGQRGVYVDIFTRRESPTQPEVDRSIGANVRVIHITAGGAVPLEPMDVYPHLQQFTSGVIAFATREFRLTYDMIYAHYWLSGWVAYKLNEVWGTPFVQMFHTLGHMKNRIDTRISGLRLPDVRITTETQIMNWADGIIAATPAEQAQLLWLYRADRRKIAIVPPGVDDQRFRPVERSVARQMLDIESDEKLLLFVGRIEPLKAVDTILEALHLLKQSSPESLQKTRLAIIGGNPEDLANDAELARLIELTKALELTDIVEFLGAKDQHLLPAYYAAATAVIMPSDYESFGMVALEAMASGTPVIATYVGGLAYLVRDNETGFLVPVREPSALADRIRILITESETQARLGRNAAELARKYAWGQIADQILAVFEDVLIRRNRNLVGQRV